MKKAYFFIPIVFLVLFALFYAKFRSGHAAREQARLEKVRLEKEARVVEDQNKRKVAYDEAVAAKKIRDEERARKAAQKIKDDEQRELAIQNRAKARTDADKLEANVKKLQKDVEETKEDIKKLEEDKRRALAEEAFLKDYVKKAQANESGLQAVLEKIALADKMAEDAAKAAAAATKK